MINEIFLIILILMILFFCFFLWLLKECDIVIVNFGKLSEYGKG